MTSAAPAQAHYAQNSPSFVEKLSDWDSATNPLAPLSTEQKDVFLELAANAGNMPLPKGLPLDEPVNVQHSAVTKQVHPAGSLEDILQKGFTDMGFSTEKVHDVQQFYAWFNKVEEKMSELEDDGYTEYLRTLKRYHDHCQNIMSVIDEALTSINNLDKEYVFVSTKTNALHDACEQLLADQTKLINAADTIQRDLVYFNEHDRIAAKLGGTNLAVTGESFQSLLMRIDECIDFMVKHSTYHDSAEYLAKFKVCRANALLMIKKYIVKSLNETTSNILNRKAATAEESHPEFTLGSEHISSNTPEDAFTLYYGKFRTNAARIIGLVEQIEKRLDLDPDYGHLLNEIYNCYFSKREQLVGPSVTAAMADLLIANKQDQCSLVRSGCSFMVHVCEDEHQLYSHFFTKISPKLDEMLERLCSGLYDMLRPLIIHVYHLETLSELCTILKTEMLDDHVQNYPEQLKAFEYVAKQMLEDVQERLVFRVNIHVRDDILGYKPAPGDLAYPEKLEMMEEIARNLKETAAKQASEKSFTEIKLDDSMETDDDQTKKSQDRDQAFKTSPADMHGMWFPTVRRVLVCLSKLYRCIDKTIFQGLSQEALQACVQSLVNASNAIRTQNFVKDTGKAGKSKVIDSQLFLIKHLLILREQIAPFQGEFAIREMQLDFTRTRDAAYHMLDFQTLPKLLRVDSNNAVLQFFVEGSPEVKEFYIDSKKDVDRQLKSTCEDFIEHVSKSFTKALDDFLAKAKVVINLNNEDGGPRTSLRQQPFATPEVLKDIVASAYRDVKLVGKAVQSSLSLYLANRETENILFKPVKLNVQQVYQQLQMILLENYTEEDRAIIAAPTPDQVSALLSAVRK